MKELTDKLDSISAITDHYLVKAKSTGNNYYDEFIEAAAIMKLVLTKKEFEFWCSEKMLLKQQVFAEKTFIQFAVETSVARFFGERFPTGFKVEAQINPTNKKDVDCQFKDNSFTFNVEVKCSDFISKEEIDKQDGFKYSTIGRLPDRGQEAMAVVSSALDEGLAKKDEPLKPHLVSKNMDNNLKIFLELAHEKFNPTPSENELNILIVGCDDVEDMQSWLNYLWEAEGLFTNESFADVKKYQNVDLVVLTNQYYKHNKYFDKKVKDSWTLDKGFNLIFQNPFRLLKKEKAINHFLKIIPNYTEQFIKYNVPGPAPDYVKKSRKVVWFVKDNLEKKQNTYLFDPKPDK